MTYPETIAYLQSFVDYERLSLYPREAAFKLERMQDFLAAIGDPQATLRCIHVAGSKGKGSTCAFIAYILRQAGFRTGLYTSPHLSDFRERIRVLLPQSAESGVFEGMIPRKDLAEILARLKPAIEAYNVRSPHGPLTFFEVYTALAFLYFKEQHTDFVVLETGLGGRLDATNTVSSLVSVLTPISYEHVQILGTTLAEIASEKSGIIKASNSVVIIAPQEEEALGVIQARCLQVKANSFLVGEDIRFSSTEDKFSVCCFDREYTDLRSQVLGRHQFVNAACAVGATASLRFHGIDISAQAIREGIALCRWPGRCEIIGRHPYVVVDGAQNAASAKVLAQAIREHFSYRKLILVLGVCGDKDARGITGYLRDLADRVIVTRAGTARALMPEKLAAYFTGIPVTLTQSVVEARTCAEGCAAEDDLILVCGSLFVAGEYRNEECKSD